MAKKRQYDLELRKGVATIRVDGLMRNVYTYNVLLDDLTVATFLYQEDALDHLAKLRKRYPTKRHHKS